MARSVRNRSTIPRQGATLTLLVAIVISGCTPQTEPRASHGTAPPPIAPTIESPNNDTAENPAAADSPTAAVTANYELGATALTIEVGKAGRLARLGHNHIVHSTVVNGQLTIDTNDQLEADIYVPVTSLLVDDPKQRAIHRSRDPQSYGSEPTAQQIASTRANMLSQRVLNYEAHGFLQARVTAEDPSFTQILREASPTIEPHQTPARLELQIAGHKATVKCTIHWRSRGDRLAWDTRFAVSHENLGLTPFSALAGALRVAEEIKITIAGEITLLDATGVRDTAS